MKKRVLIVDDEALARTRIRRTLEALDGYEIQEARDGFEALDRIHDFKPELVFLDIEMPELNGFEVLSNVGTRGFQVVFQTAFDQFAVKAFEVNACDYLLKPFTDERLRQSLQRAFGTPAQHPADPIEKLDQYLTSEQLYLEKFVVRAGTRNRVIDANEVFYFLSESHITRIFLEKIDFAYDHSLNYLEEKLDPKRFLRIHRNCIIRLDALATFAHGANAAVTLKNGATVQASREGAKALKSRLNG